jgi:hypothetical protein
MARLWRTSVAGALTLAVLAACARRGTSEVAPAADNLAWVASTCSEALPDTTGWTRHRFSELSIAVPPGFTVSNSSSRAIRFRRGSSTLILSIGTQLRSIGLYARPDRTDHEKACPVMPGGYAAEILGTWYGQTFTVSAEWDGRNFWPAGDWRRWLHASAGSSRVSEATLLRQALWTIRADRDSVRITRGTL